MTQNNYCFLTGAPGSAWTGIGNKLIKSHDLFDNSDRRLWRKFKIKEEHFERYNIPLTEARFTHAGAYWGPGNEFGEDFEDLSKLNIEDFYKECGRAFSNPEKPNKLIKCHWFAYNLDWLWENCSGHSLLMIWRDPKVCEEWWYSIGGWDIDHPKYTWYDNPNRMTEKIIEENECIEKFCKTKNIVLEPYHHEWMLKHFEPEHLIIEEVQKGLMVQFPDMLKIGYTKIP